MIRKILSADTPTLRKRSKAVEKIDKKIKDLVKDLKDTLKVQKDPEGVGLAAPQIGKNLRVFVMLEEGKAKAVINPIVTSKPRTKSAKRRKTKDLPLEGCLSIPQYYGPLNRHEKIKIKFLDENGGENEKEFRGFAAQIVQHEIDHLEGILFIDRILEKKLPLFELKGKEWVKVDL